MKKEKLMLGDNIESLKKLPENSIDSVVTDGPYGLSFMNKKWDYDVPSVDFWSEVFRVLKPGGHLLSFGGTRTYHRMVVNIEDAGFEIRDQIQWLYGSGFPKSLNVGKAVDKLNGVEREVVGVEERQLKNGGNEDWLISDKKRENIDYTITKGQSEWEGWGSALKPANEPICLARKPLSEKSIAENVLKWKTGGLNIDGCRIGTNDTYNYKNGPKGNSFSVGKEPDGKRTEPVEMNPEGRFPANLILDESAAEMLDEQSGNTSRFFYVAKVSKAERNMGLDSFEEKKKDFETTTRTNKETADKFGCERKGTAKNTHPTVKPVNLMSYLCKLITPPNGIILDPFMGSGSTGIAALLNDFRFVGMEMDNDYFKIAEARINSYEDYRKFIKKVGPKDKTKSGASRFFYVAKVSKAERNMGLDEFDEVDESKNKAFDVEGGRRSKYDLSIKKNNHPTVKPVNLMSYLCKLITPPNGIVLDPFMGSGSTGIAALLNDFRFVGMEMDNDYFKIAEARINSYEDYRKFLKK